MTSRSILSINPTSEQRLVEPQLRPWLLLVVFEYRDATVKSCESSTLLQTYDFQRTCANI